MRTGMRMPADPVPRLSIRKLHAGYGHTEILHGVDLELAPGRSLCLVGPNGAGKSTVLNAVFGLAEVHQGRIEVVDIEGQGDAANVVGRNLDPINVDIVLKIPFIADIANDADGGRRRVGDIGDVSRGKIVETDNRRGGET